MSSATSDCVKELEAAYRPKGIAVIDAPVSGGAHPGRSQGTLTIFGSGDETAFEEVRPALSAMGRELYYLGPCGTGKAFKNLNNLLSVGNTVLVSEASGSPAKTAWTPGCFTMSSTRAPVLRQALKRAGPEWKRKTFPAVFSLPSHART